MLDPTIIVALISGPLALVIGAFLKRSETRVDKSDKAMDKLIDIIADQRTENLKVSAERDDLKRELAQRASVIPGSELT